MKMVTLSAAARSARRMRFAKSRSPSSPRDPRPGVVLVVQVPHVPHGGVAVADLQRVRSGADRLDRRGVGADHRVVGGGIEASSGCRQQRAAHSAGDREYGRNVAATRYAPAGPAAAGRASPGGRAACISAAGEEPGDLGDGLLAAAHGDHPVMREANRELVGRPHDRIVRTRRCKRKDTERRTSAVGGRASCPPQAGGTPAPQLVSSGLRFFHGADDFGGGLGRGCFGR